MTKGERMAKVMVQEAGRHLDGGDWRVSCNADMLERHVARTIDRAIAEERARCVQHINAITVRGSLRYELQNALTSDAELCPVSPR